MVGFIGALSSSLCILILVFITLLLGYIDSIVPNTSLFKVSEAAHRFPINSYFVTDAIKDDFINVIELLAGQGVRPNDIMIGCTAGFDIEQSMARNIMVYNAIKINSFNLSLDAKIYPDPLIKKDQMNFCYLDFLSKKDG